MFTSFSHNLRPPFRDSLYTIDQISSPCMRKNQSPMVTLSVMRSTVTASTVMLVRVRRAAFRSAREQTVRRR